MNSCIWTSRGYLILLLTVLHTESNADQLCTKTENCQCLNNSDHFEYQCSNEQVILHVYPDSMIQIECNNLNNLNLKKLPKVEFRNVNKLKINYCPLPENGMKELVDHFGLQTLNTLVFEYGSLENETLPTNKFLGLEKVTILKLKANDLARVEKNFFENFPELIALELDRNNLKFENNLFSPLSKLKFLSLSSNNLEGFPRNFFQNLSSLEKLYLWKNNLKSLEEQSLEGLTGLKVLELAYNKISTIDRDVFHHTPNLANVSFRFNTLQNISRKTFELNKLLEQVVLSGNPGLSLENGIFSNFEDLKIIEMENLKINTLPEYIFENSSSLIYVSLEKNELKNISEYTFKDSVKMKQLSLAHNKIKSIDDETFSFMINLEKLDLQDNELEEINSELFKSLTKLKELNLNSNRIKNIHLGAFSRNKNLQKFFMRQNLYRYEYKSIYPISPFNKCGNLEEIDLSHNDVIDFPEDLIFLPSLRAINISYNNISTLRVNSLWKITTNKLTIDLESNKLSHLNFENVEVMAYQQPNLDAYHNTGSPVVIRISKNPIVCDCFAIDFIKYIRNEMYAGVKTSIFFIYDGLLCASPEIFEGISVENITPPMLICPIEELIQNFRCTNNDQCVCYWRPFDYSLVINCDGKNLTSFPKIIHPEKLIFNQTEVSLRNNLLEFGPSANETAYWNITKLFLNGNKIDSLNWIPPNLEVLDLRNNQLEYISNAVLGQMNSTSLKKIVLQENPWKCDCSSTFFTNFLRQHVLQVDTSDVFCNGTSIPLMNLNEKDLCPTNPLLLVITAIFILILCLLSSTAALYYKYQQEIKVWMYAHNVCLFLIQEEELDKDKIYDAFVSYSHKDEDFVIENLLSVLEDGPKPYKLCLHFRNWIPGEFIAKQVTTSVKDSKRTLVVLSPNFLESVWGKMEFRTAHTEAMREGRARVIIVLYGDIDIESLDDELKAYMKTNTYIKWGDPWFWDKLKYALPHSKIKDVNCKLQKHANMMKYIEDKFVLVDNKAANKINTTYISDTDEKESDVAYTFNENFKLRKGIV